MICSTYLYCEHTAGDFLCHACAQSLIAQRDKRKRHNSSKHRLTTYMHACMRAADPRELRRLGAPAKVQRVNVAFGCIRSKCARNDSVSGTHTQSYLTRLAAQTIGQGRAACAYLCSNHNHIYLLFYVCNVLVRRVFFCRRFVRVDRLSVMMIAPRPKMSGRPVPPYRGSVIRKRHIVRVPHAHAAAQHPG